MPFTKFVKQVIDALIQQLFLSIKYLAGLKLFDQAIFTHL